MNGGPAGLKTALIIGAGGFIGRRLALQLAQRGVAVTATTRRAEAVAGATRTVQLDITDSGPVEAILSGEAYDTVYYLAAVTEHHLLANAPLDCLDAYVKATVTISKAFARSGSRRMIYSSTGKVYGPIVGRPIRESDPVSPSNVLGRVKVLAEAILMFTGRVTPDKQIVIARIFNIYGPGQKDTFILPTILNQLRFGSKVVLGNLDDGRDYVYIDDLVDALDLLGKKAGLQPLEIFNVGTAQAASVRDMLGEIERLTGRRIEVQQRTEKMRADEHSSECGDYSRLAALGWQPRTTLAAGIEACIQQSYPFLLP